MSAEMPPMVGVRFAHAALQVLADDHGVDILHIKGPSVDDRLLEHLEGDDVDTAVAGSESVPRDSVDADVLVRPSHLVRLVEAMHVHGWSTQFRFEDGSAFEHASTMVHEFLAPVDLHRNFPGIGLDSEAAFDRLWVDRHAAPIAGYACAVPSVAAQRLLLLLHAARGGIAGNPDVQRCWTDATSDERQEVEALARQLGAEVPLAAATGRLEEFKHERGHDLWAALSRGERSMVRVWMARVRAAPTVSEAFQTALRLLLPKPHRLQQFLGRPLTRRELASAYLLRARWGVDEVRRLITSRRGSKTS